MNHPTSQTEQRLSRLEKQLRISYAITGSLLLLLILSFAAKDKQGETQIIRTKGITILDDAGRERIYIGAPVPDPQGYGQRQSAYTGLTINDPSGHERFGVGVDEQGNMAMGFDAPPGKGDPRNPERINIVADSEGGSFIRFLNRKTEVVSFLRLDENDEFALEFIDRKTGKIMRKQMRYNGEKVVEWK